MATPWGDIAPLRDVGDGLAKLRGLAFPAPAEPSRCPDPSALPPSESGAVVLREPLRAGVPPGARAWGGLALPLPFPPLATFVPPPEEEEEELAGAVLETATFAALVPPAATAAAETAAAAAAEADAADADAAEAEADATEADTAEPLTAIVPSPFLADGC